MTAADAAATSAKPAYVAAGPAAAWSVGSARETAALAPKLVSVASAAARERAARGEDFAHDEPRNGAEGDLEAEWGEGGRVSGGWGLVARIVGGGIATLFTPPAPITLSLLARAPGTPPRTATGPPLTPRRRPGRRGLGRRRGLRARRPGGARARVVVGAAPRPPPPRPTSLPPHHDAHPPNQQRAPPRPVDRRDGDAGGKKLEDPQPRGHARRLRALGKPGRGKDGGGVVEDGGLARDLLHGHQTQTNRERAPIAPTPQELAQRRRPHAELARGVGGGHHARQLGVDGGGVGARAAAGARERGARAVGAFSGQ